MGIANIISALDAELKRLQQARSLLTTSSLHTATAPNPATKHRQTEDERRSTKDCDSDAQALGKPEVAKVRVCRIRKSTIRLRLKASLGHTP